MTALGAAGSAQVFAANLAAGMTVEGASGPVTVQCVLGVDCDAFAVTAEVRRIQTGQDPSSCASDAQDVCAAYRVMDSSTMSAEVVAAARRFLTELTTHSAADRYAQVDIALGHALEGVSGDGTPESVASALVALVVFAYEAIPADAPANDLLPAGGVSPATGEDDGDSPACGDTGIVALRSQSGTTGARAVNAVTLCATLDLLAGTKKVTCTASFEYYAFLQTHSNDWDNRLFDLEAEHGIQNLTITPDVAGYKCPKTRVEFNGTIYEEMHSNAGSWASNSETSGAPETQWGILYPYPAWMGVDVNVYWTHKKVTTTHGPFWIDYTGHFWSPPGGNYDSYGTARLALNNGYRFSDKKSVHNATSHCTQKGNPTECEYWGY